MIELEVERKSGYYLFKIIKYPSRSTFIHSYRERRENDSYFISCGERHKEITSISDAIYLCPEAYK